MAHARPRGDRGDRLILALALALLLVPEAGEADGPAAAVREHAAAWWRGPVAPQRGFGGSVWVFSSIVGVS